MLTIAEEEHKLDNRFLIELAQGQSITPIYLITPQFSQQKNRDFPLGWPCPLESLGQ